MNEKNNVVKFHRVPRLSIGAVIIVFIFVYVVFHMFSYLTSSNVSVAIVKEGNIVWDDHYNALAIREEQMYFATESGYIYYDGRNKSRVGVRSLVYSIDQKGDITDKLKKSESSSSGLSEDDTGIILSELSGFVSDFDPVNFRRVYSFSSNLTDTLEMALHSESAARLSDEIKTAEANSTYHRYYAPETGLAVFSTDGFEDISLGSVTESSFDMTKLDYINLRKREKVETGDPVYKLITSDDWQLVMPISNQVAARLQDQKSVKVLFTEDHVSTWTSSEIREKDSKKYLVLSLDDSMERYADQRFIGIDLIFDEERGLKVPNTSITKRRYDKIPSEYLTNGGDTQKSGFLVDRGEDSPVFVPTGYFKEDEDGSYLVAHSSFEEGDVIIDPNNTSDRYSLSEERSVMLDGVYNVNKGYAQFKPVEILYSNDEYSIIKPVKTNDVNLYDHIALSAGDIIEDDVII